MVAVPEEHIRIRDTWQWSESCSALALTIRPGLDAGRMMGKEDDGAARDVLCSDDEVSQNGGQNRKKTCGGAGERRRCPR